MLDSIGRAAVSVVLATLLGAAAHAQVPGMPPGAAGGAGAPSPQLQQTELTESSAKGAIDAYLSIKEKYGDDTPAFNAKRPTVEGYAALKGIEGIVGGQGFSDTSEWHTTLVSVVLAYGFAKEGKAGEMDKAIADIKANAQVPETLKQQMIAMIAGVRPSENNLAVVNGLMGDSDYGAKLVDITK
jgi:hypothetical protein